MRDDRDVGPTPGDGIELWGEMVKVRHVGLRHPGGRERAFPHRREVVGELRRNRREHDVRRVGAVLERRGHRHRRRNRAPTREEHAERVGVVNRMHVGAREERPPVGLGTGDSERSRHDGHVPTGARQRVRQIPRDVRRAAAREEHQPHHNAPRAHTFEH